MTSGSSVPSGRILGGMALHRHTARVRSAAYPGITLILGASLIGMTACSSGLVPSPVATVTVTALPTSSTNPTGATTPTGTTASTGTKTSATARTMRDVSGGDMYSFATPTGNIVCLLVGKGSGAASDYVRCTIRQKTWVGPARPTSCDLDYGTDLAVSSPGRGEFTCAGDTVLGIPGQAAVGYGTTVRMGQAACEVDSNGVTCRAGSHGFFMAKESYRLF